MKTVVILGNHHVVLYNFRKELIERLISENYRVITALPYTKEVEKLRKLGCEIVDIPVARRGTNPITDLKLFLQYRKLLQKEKPDMVYTYTIKPNIYGGMACRLLKIPYLVNITGLGSAMEGDGFLQKVTSFLYRFAMKKADCIFFQNEMNRQVFEKRSIHGKAEQLLPGSGVNLEHFSYMEMPQKENIEFVYISRVMREKGIEQYLETADVIRKKYPNTRFHILGFCEEEYEERLKNLQEQGIIEYHGMQEDVRVFLKEAHCLVHPSYYPEGMSNVCLEAAACGRAVITTKRSGCMETVDDGVTGYLVEEKSAEQLTEAVERFILLSEIEKCEMGQKARQKMEREFDREQIVSAYMERTKI